MSAANKMMGWIVGQKIKRIAKADESWVTIEPNGIKIHRALIIEKKGSRLEVR